MHRNVELVNLKTCWLSFLSRFGDLTGFDTTRADLHTLNTTLWSLDSNGLQIWIEPTPGTVVSMRNIVAELRRLATDFASFSHILVNTSEQIKSRNGHSVWCI
jgi:hypothetical protein